MRGALVVRARHHLLEGIIPAYAGSTIIAPSSPWRCRDHPRVCGEHSAATTTARTVWGSSPRMRGARIPPCLYWISDGIIPAYAGSTACCIDPPTQPEDHPRVCGEHVLTWWPHLTGAGSSPRMRGAPGHVDLVCELGGIIPAYAGSTWTGYAASTWGWDHPRVCGEHYLGVIELAQPGGIIPAYAGSTGPHPHSCAGLRDHPRVCGEHCARHVGASSP